MSPTVDIDVLPKCWDPNPGTPMIQLVSVGPGLYGTYSIVNGKVRAALNSGIRAVDKVPYTIGRGGKFSTSKLILNIDTTGGMSPPPVTEEPAYDRTYTVGFTMDGATHYDTPQAAQAAAPPGTRIILNGSTNSYGALNLTKGGTQAKPVYWTARDGQMGLVKWAPNLSAADIWLRGINVGAAQMSIAGARCRVWRCSFSGFNSGTDVQVYISGPNVYFCYNQITECLSRGVKFSVKNGALNGVMGRNWLYNFQGTGNTHETAQAGEDPSTRSTLMGLLFAENLFERCNWPATGEEEPISVKGSGCTIRGNTLLDCAMLSNRHGAKGNNILSNWCEGGRGGIILYDQGGLAAGNRVIGGNGFLLIAGDATPTSYFNGCFVAATGWTLRGNQADKLIVGYDRAHSGSPVLPARNTRIEAHTGTPTLKSETGTVQVATAGGAYTPARKLGRGEVGPNASWQGWPMLAA